jgi:prepilin-type N-terminal cleavage/methylation domain-containing protein
MLSKLKKSNNEGFTIIEVMIVLAIAGLILLIVFLAVPALQRSSRNTQRKSDVGRLGSAATTVVSNLNGQTVTNALFSGAILTNEAGTLGYYQAANVQASVATAAVTNATTKDNGVNAAVSERSVAILYSTETGGTDAKTCVNE